MKYTPKNQNYDDIIDLPHHRSQTRGHMSLHDRAAQFAPFAALTGHEDAIEETGRRTSEQVFLEETDLERLNRRILVLQERLEGVNTKALYDEERAESLPVVTAVFFRPDERKEGGAYLEKTGIVRKVDVYGRSLIWADGTVMGLDLVRDLSGEIFRGIEE